jgi:hypothetical protein
VLDPGAVATLALIDDGADRLQPETGLLGNVAQRGPALVQRAHLLDLRLAGSWALNSYQHCGVLFDAADNHAFVG